MSNKSGASEQIISVPKGGGALKGIGETFSPDLHTGTGNFTCPISIPAGRNNFQPQLNLTYSTGNGNGPFGLGWSLGIPGVSRKTSRGVPKYHSGQDVYILSGAEDLISVSQDPSGTTYFRPRTEGLFARIIHHRDASNDYWEVYSKDGLVNQYGTAGAAGEDPAVVADPADRSRVFAWNLTRTQDPFGNIIVYEYERDSGQDGPHHWDQVYLKKIAYADYEEDSATRFLVTVSLQYEARPDPSSSYKSGFEVRTRKRCTRLEVFTHAQEELLARSYDFVYLDQCPEQEGKRLLNGASVLNRIEVTGYDGNRTQSLPPLEFGYTRFEPEGRKFFPVEGLDLPTRGLNSQDLETADLFGNGLPDIIEMNGTVRCWRNRGNGSFDVPRPMSRAPAGLRLGDPGVQMIDANGDGRVDLLVINGAMAGYFPLAFGKMWDDSSFQRYQYVPSFRLDDPEVKLVDLDGDGITDVVRSGTRFECVFNDPRRGWHRIRQVPRRTVEDFPNVSFSDPRVKLSDMCGDGLQDIVMVYDGAVEYWPSLGHGNWGKRITMFNSPRFPFAYDPRRILLGDVDGDGLADLVYVDDSRVTLWINQGGSRWSDPIEIQGTPTVWDSDAVRLTDLLGCGIAGILWSADANGRALSNMFFLDFTGGVKPYLLNEMNNHMGAITRVEYAPSTRFYLEDDAMPETRWETSLPFPVQVVARVEVIDALSGGKTTSEYSYHHGYWDGEEREFRGFGRVDQRDTEVFQRYHDGGLHQGQPFAPVAEENFSPPAETRTWFHQGPIGEGAGDWDEANYSSEFWPGDPSGLERPSSLTAFLGSLPRRDRRDALRALRGCVLRTELYALDGSVRQDRPYTVTESLYGVREEVPLAASQEVRQRVFFPHLLAQRTTQWERGNDPMTQLTFYADYDQFGQHRSETNLAVPRGRDFRVAAPFSEPYLGTYTWTDYAVQQYPLAFKDITGLVFDGDTLRKTAPTGWGNGGTSGLNLLEPGEDGWVEAGTSTVGLGAMLGLSRTNGDDNYATTDYALFFSQSNSLIIYERGAVKASFPDLTPSDIARIERTGTTIQYNCNGKVIYTSDVPSTSSLSADLSFYHQGATLTNLRSSKPVQGATPISSTDFVDVVGLEFDGPVIRKTAPLGWDNSGAVSSRYLELGNDGWVEASTPRPGLRAFFGLSEISRDNHYNSIDYAIYFSNSPSIMVYEKGIYKRGVTNLTTQDVVRIERVGTEVRYLRNGQVFYVSQVPSATRLYVDLAFYDPGAEITGLTFSEEVRAGYIADRASRVTSFEIINDGTSDAFSLYDSVLDGSCQRRLMGQQVNLYDGPAFHGRTWGQIGPYGQVSRTLSLVLTEDILHDAYRSGIEVLDPPEVPPYLNGGEGVAWPAEYPQEFRAQVPAMGSYIFQSGGGSPFERGYYVPAKERCYDFQRGPARKTRGMLAATRNALGGESTVKYDGYDLLPISETDPAGMTVTAINDYRILQAREVVDVNGNRTTCSFTPLGFLESMAALGKTESDGGDTIEVPGCRLEYDLMAYCQRGQPVSLRTVQRIHHVNDTSIPLPRRNETIQSIEYSDGFGRVIQTRSQAEDVTFHDLGLPSDQSQPVGDAVGLQRPSDGPPNVLVSGWQVHDNKGRLVEKYEPFYSSGWDFSPPSEGTAGQKIVMYYDPRGRVVLTINPDGSSQRMVYGVPSEFSSHGHNHHTVNGVDFVDVVGLEFDGRTIRKSASTGWHNGDALSVGYFAAGEDGWIEASTATLGLGVMFGLRSTDRVEGYQTIDHAIYFSQHTTAIVYEQGLFKAGFADLSEADVVRIERAGNVVQYKRNGEVFYTSEASSLARLHISLAFYHTAAELRDIAFSSPEAFVPTPWEVYTYDQNDDAQRTHGTGDPSHWDTPNSTIVDSLGRNVQTVERNGSDPQTDWVVTRSTYDIRGNQLTVTDALGRLAFSYVYDLADNELRRESIDAGTQRIVVGAAGRPLEWRDSKGTLALNSYDQLKRPIRVWSRDSANEPVTLRERLVYGDSPESELTPAQARDANLLGELYRHYNEAGLLVMERFDFKGNLQEKVRFIVDETEVLKAFTPPPPDWQVAAFRMDWHPPQGSSLADLIAGLLKSNPYRTSVTYDALDRVIAVRYPQDADGQRKLLTSQYNSAGALERVELEGVVYVDHIAYDARGQRILVAYGNGIMTRYSYDPQSYRLVRLRSERYEEPIGQQFTFRPVQPSQPLQDCGYSYDLMGNILSIIDRHPCSGIPNNPDSTSVSDHVLAQLLASGDALIRRFSYDPLYRLRTATGRESHVPPPLPPWQSSPRSADATLAQAYGENYHYDAVGSLLLLQHHNDEGGFTREFTLAEGSNRLASSITGGTTYQYAFDENGNLTGEDSSRHFEWDSNNRVRVFRTQVSGAEPSIYAHYLYDTSGQRVQKVVRKQGGQVESTIYVDGMFEHHMVHNGGTHDNNTLHVIDGENRIAEVRIGQPLPGEVMPETTFHLGDHLGSSNVVTDGDGNLVNREEYSPFGETTFGSYARKRFRLAGKERDDESGLYLMKARYYAPWLCRWVSTDPLGPADGPGLYTYCLNNPLRMKDQEGLQSHDVEGVQAAAPKTDACQTNHHLRRPPSLASPAELHQELGMAPPAEPTMEDVQKWLVPPKPKGQKPGKAAPSSQGRGGPSVQFEEPFPNLAARAKTSRHYQKEYDKAMDAWVKYKKMEYFRFYYLALGQLARGQGIEGIPGEKPGLLKGAIDESAKFLLDNRVRGDFVQQAGGIKLHAVVDRALLLIDLKMRLDNERLENMADRSLDDERFARNMKKVRWEMAGAISRQTSGSQTYWNNWLAHQYREFEPVFNEYSNYKLLDQSLDPHFQSGPAMWPAPARRR